MAPCARPAERPGGGPLWDLLTTGSCACRAACCRRHSHSWLCSFNEIAVEPLGFVIPSCCEKPRSRGRGDFGLLFTTLLESNPCKIIARTSLESYPCAKIGGIHPLRRTCIATAGMTNRGPQHARFLRIGVTTRGEGTLFRQLQSANESAATLSECALIRTGGGGCNPPHPRHAA
jgi:hypothetical protein